MSESNAEFSEDSVMRSVWNVLLSKTDIEARKARLKVQDLKDKKDRAAEQNRKLDDLISEYHGRLVEIQKRPHNFPEAASYRQFIVQMQDLRKRSEVELTVAEKNLSLAKKDMFVMENERMKYESLMEREKSIVQRSRNTKETKITEEEATLQYNWK